MSNSVRIPVIKSWSLKLTTYLYLVPKLKMVGAVPLCLLYAFMTLTGAYLRLIACVQQNTGLQAGTDRKQGIITMFLKG